MVAEMNKVCQDAAVGMTRAALPMTSRWMLHNQIPRVTGKMMDLAFFPLLFVLSCTALQAVATRKQIIGM